MKMILVVDIPDDWHCKEWCIEGDLMGKNEDGYWVFCNEIVEKPLKPMPEQKDVGYPNDDYDVGFGDGWDACLKEIEK